MESQEANESPGPPSRQLKKRQSTRRSAVTTASESAIASQPSNRGILMRDLASCACFMAAALSYFVNDKVVSPWVSCLMCLPPFLLIFWRNSDLHRIKLLFGTVQVGMIMVNVIIYSFIRLFISGGSILYVVSWICSVTFMVLQDIQQVVISRYSLLIGMILCMAVNIINLLKLFGVYDGFDLQRGPYAYLMSREFEFMMLRSTVMFIVQLFLSNTVKILGRFFTHKVDYFRFYFFLRSGIVRDIQLEEEKQKEEDRIHRGDNNNAVNSGGIGGKVAPLPPAGEDAVVQRTVVDPDYIDEGDANALGRLGSQSAIKLANRVAQGNLLSNPLPQPWEALSNQDTSRISAAGAVEADHRLGSVSHRIASIVDTQIKSKSCVVVHNKMMVFITLQFSVGIYFGYGAIPATLPAVQDLFTVMPLVGTLALIVMLNYGNFNLETWKLIFHPQYTKVGWTNISLTLYNAACLYEIISRTSSNDWSPSTKSGSPYSMLRHIVNLLNLDFAWIMLISLDCAFKPHNIAKKVISIVIIVNSTLIYKNYFLNSYAWDVTFFAGSDKIVPFTYQGLISALYGNLFTFFVVSQLSVLCDWRGNKITFASAPLLRPKFHGLMGFNLPKVIAYPSKIALTQAIADMKNPANVVVS